MNEKQRQAERATDAYKGRMASLVKSIVNNNMHAIRDRMNKQFEDACKAAIPAKAIPVFEEYQELQKKVNALKKKIESMGCAINSTYPSYKAFVTLAHNTKREKLVQQYQFSNFEYIHRYSRRVLGAQTVGEVEAIVSEIECIK